MKLQRIKGLKDLNFRPFFSYLWQFCNTLTKLLNRTFCNRTKPYRICIFGDPFGDPLKLDKIGFGVVYIVLETFRSCQNLSPPDAARHFPATQVTGLLSSWRCTRSLPSHPRSFRKLHPPVSRYFRKSAQHVARTPPLHVAVRSPRQGHGNPCAAFARGPRMTDSVITASTTRQQQNLAYCTVSHPTIITVRMTELA